MKAIHFMKLNPKMFSYVSDGRKTVELRLYDEKRQLVKSGDTIIFKNTADLNSTVEVTVCAVNWFDSFKVTPHNYSACIAQSDFSSDVLKFKSILAYV